MSAGKSALIVVDTSAMVAVLIDEPGGQKIADVLLRERCIVPAPVLVELASVAIGGRQKPPEIVENFIKTVCRTDESVPVFGEEDAAFARRALLTYGKGRGNRAQLNIVDLMVYGIARRLGAPILCTGRDFAETDALIHPASRLS